MRPAVPPPAAPERPVVRVVQPCGSLTEHAAAVEAGIARLEAHGCRVRWDASSVSRRWRDYLAGTDDERAAELVAAFEEPDVDVVWLARGGSGLGRIAARVLDRLAALPPRLLVGFSDATSLLNAMAVHLGRLVFHGPMVASLARADITVDLEETLAVLRGECTEICFAGAPGGHFDGLLLGGNLSVLATVAGTPLAATARDAIWVIEDVNEARYRLDRALWQVRAAGLLEGARALWVGDLHLPAVDEALALSMFADDARPVPVVGGAPAGHRGHLATLPIGGHVLLDAPAGRLTAGAPWVQTGGAHV